MSFNNLKTTQQATQTNQHRPTWKYGKLKLTTYIFEIISAVLVCGINNIMLIYCFKIEEPF